MKGLIITAMILSMTAFGFETALAGTFISGSTGADGAFNPSADTELQTPPDGVLNFTTVNIPAGVTVKFKKNSANTPVYLLATGDVIISGRISIDGGRAQYFGRKGTAGSPTFGMSKASRRTSKMHLPGQGVPRFRLNWRIA